MLIVPGAAGEIGILARHAPLVATLKAAARVYIRREKKRSESSRRGPSSSRWSRTARWRSWTTRSTHGTSTPSALQQQFEEAQAELERIERGESDADRWQVERRIAHAQNQLDVYAGGGSVRIRPVVG